MGRSCGWSDLGKRMRALDALGQEGERPSARLALRHRFRFLNEERELVAIDWSGEYASPLWTYHLHYFDYAVDLARAWRTTDDQRYGDRYLELWESWLDAAEAGRARIEPYPTSVRCLNALQSLWLIEDRVPTGFAARLLRATHQQLDWLTGNIERHLRANHLQKNLTALAWGSLAFEGEEVAHWSRYRDELWEEFGEQVLSDGGHFERSPMYHAAALDDFLRTLALCRSAGVTVPNDVPERLEMMTRALQCLSRPDDTLQLFNDAANGERPTRNDVIALARAVLGDDYPEPSGAFALTDTGYYGYLDPASGLRLVIDAGPLGPLYQPGHAHCDMLSFELDLAGRSVVVDAGVHGYDGDPYREYVRSTRAHNTVAIDGREQHEMWATFRVARRGEIVGARDARGMHGEFRFEGACRHYHDERMIHRRLIEFCGDELHITDRVKGGSGQRLTSWLHLHPDFRVMALGPGLLATADEACALRVSIEVFGADDAVVHFGRTHPVQGWYCPEFGRAFPAAAIELRVGANDGREFGYRLRPVRV